MAFQVCRHFLEQIPNLAIGISELRNEELGDKRRLTSQQSQLESSIEHFSCHTVVCSPDSCCVGPTIAIPCISHVTSDELGNILITTRTNEIGLLSGIAVKENALGTRTFVQAVIRQ